MSEPPYDLEDSPWGPVLEEETLFLRKGERRSLEVEVKAGDFVALSLVQRGVDVEIELFPAGAATGDEPWFVGDSPNGRFGPEVLPWIADHAARLRFVIVGLKGAGDVEKVELTGPRPATLEDRRWIAADRDRASRDEGTLLRAARELEALGKAALAAECWYRVAMKGSDPERDLLLIEDAVEAFRAADDPAGLSRALIEAGRLLNAQERREEARVALMEALELREGLGEGDYAALAASRCAEAEHALGRSLRALDLLERARRLEPEPDTLALVLTQRSKVLLDVGSFDLARASAEEGLELFDQLDDRAEAAKAAREVANSARRAGLFDPARGYLRQAQRYEGGEASPETLLQRAQVERSEAVQESPYAPDTALVARSEGLLRQVLEESSGSRMRGVASLELGYLATVTGRFALAEEHFDRADQWLEENRDPPLAASLLARRGELFARRGDLDAALDHLERSIDRIERLRVGPELPDLQADYLASRLDYYDLAIDVLWRQEGRRREAQEDDFGRRALEIFEQRRARAFIDGSSRIRRSPSAEQRREIEALEMSLARRAQQGVRGSELREDLNRLSRLHYGMPEDEDLLTREPLSIAEMRQQLDHESVLVSFMVGQQSGYVWTLDAAGSLEWRLIPGRSVLEPAIEHLRSHLQRSGDASRTLVERRIQELSEALLSPIATSLRGRRLVLVAEGPLVDLPFALLEMAGEPLIEQFELVRLPSLSAAAAMRVRRARRQAPERSIIAFGDPVFSPSDLRLSADSVSDISAPPTRRREVIRSGIAFERRLEASGEEARDVVTRLPGYRSSVQLGFDARRDRFLDGSLRNRGVIHVASHAVDDGEQPELSGIWLSAFDAGGRRLPADGFVSAFEIAGLEISADLVVLSGCRTALGRELEGEGVQGLVRSFLDAGASSVVASLWPVGDRSTQRFMQDFYEALGSGATTSSALHRAQVEGLRSGEPARNWAGFIHVGLWEGKVDGRTEGERAESAVP